MLAVCAALLAMMWVSDADAQDVTYCTNDGGQTVIAVAKGYACPYGWYEL